MINIIQIPVLQDNYTYLVVCEKTGLAASIDSPDASATRYAAKKAGVQITTILNTHHHWDHVGGNEDLLSGTEMPVYASQIDKNRIYGVTHPLVEGDQVIIGNLSFSVLFIPGHTHGHIAFFGHGVLFCGDTLFTCGCGKLFEGTPAQMMQSLDKLRSLPAHTKVYCMHEYTQKNSEFALQIDPNNKALIKKYTEVCEKRKCRESTVPSTIAEEQLINPFLRWDHPDIIQSIQKKHPSVLSDPLSIFTALRKMKDAH